MNLMMVAGVHILVLIILYNVEVIDIRNSK